MEAAYTAKMRGHEVVLCEKNQELGGLLRLASVPIGKQELCKVIKFMARGLKNAGVEVRMNCEVTLDMISSDFEGYEIICATGAKPKEIEAFQGFKQTMTADEVLSGKGFPANRDVTVIEMTDTWMAGEGGAAKSVLIQRLLRKGVKLQLNSTIKKVDETTITYEKEGKDHVIDDADTLIFAVGYAPVPVDCSYAHVLGDCEKVGNLKDAIAAAYDFAKTL